jgi:choline dehydrogenase-like flavoprotein
MNNLFQSRLLSTEIAIAGGGPDGAAAALTLAQAGRTVTLVERSAVMGGKCSTSTSPVNLLNAVGGTPTLAGVSPAEPAASPSPQLQLIRKTFMRIEQLAQPYAPSLECEFRDHRFSRPPQSKTNSKYNEYKGNMHRKILERQTGWGFGNNGEIGNRGTIMSPRFG